MPSRKDLIDTINRNTAPLFVIDLPKINYKEGEANLILLNAILNYECLPLIDQVKKELYNSTACLSVKFIKDTMKSIYLDNAGLRTHRERDIITHIAVCLEGQTTIGRNQLIKLIITSIQEIKI